MNCYAYKLLYENEGLTPALLRTFLVYAMSSGRPLHELLAPNLIPIDSALAQEFDGMTVVRVSLDDLLETRIRLIRDIKASMDAPARQFLMSMHDGIPDFAAVNRPHAEALPAIQWKLMNLRRLMEQNPEKHAKERTALLTALGATDGRIP